MLIAFNLGTWINSMFHKILLLIDGCIFWAVSQVYQIFLKLADARIFEDSFFSNFAKRIYAIIGVVMLFYLAYALLKALVDPDNSTTGEKSLTKLAQNIVISLTILGFLPTIFDYAYRIQGIIFKENVIGAIIFGTGSTDSESISVYGNYMAYTALNPFLNPANYNVRLANDYSWFDLKADLINNGDFTRLPILSDWAVEDQETISIAYDPPGPGKTDPEEVSVGTKVSLSYKPVISTACGIALLYIMFNFCLDLGIRVVKFAFCQLIAPIPIVMRMIPGQKGTFDKWLKLTLTVYFEVFIRVAIMYLVIYFFSEIANSPMWKYEVGGIQGLVVLAIILMGLLAFAKQAPKLLSEILGLDSGNIKLGIRDKLKASGFIGNYANKGINKVIGGFNGVAGAVTGALGAGVAGVANGTSFGAGLRYGLANGWKNKGNQFNSQRKDFYQQVTGDYKGNPSLFGGQTYGTRLRNKLIGTAKEKIKTDREDAMTAFEEPIINKQAVQAREAYEQNKDNIRVRYNTEKQRFDVDKNTRISELLEDLKGQNDLYQQEKKVFETNKSNDIKILQGELDNEKSKFSANKMSQLKNLLDSIFNDNKQIKSQIDSKKLDLMNAEGNYDVVKQNRIRREIEVLEGESTRNSNLSKGIENIINNYDENTVNTELQALLNSYQSSSNLSSIDVGQISSGSNGLIPSSGGAIPSSSGAIPSSSGAIPSSGGAIPGSSGPITGSGGAVKDNSLSDELKSMLSRNNYSQNMRNIMNDEFDGSEIKNNINRLTEQINSLQNKRFDDSTSTFKNNIDRLTEEISNLQNQRFEDTDTAKEYQSELDKDFVFDRDAARASIRKAYGSDLDKYTKEAMKAKKNLSSDEAKYHSRVISNNRLGEAENLNKQREEVAKWFKNIGAKDIIQKDKGNGGNGK